MGPQVALTPEMLALFTQFRERFIQLDKAYQSKLSPAVTDYDYYGLSQLLRTWDFQDFSGNDLDFLIHFNNIAAEADEAELARGYSNKGGDRLSNILYHELPKRSNDEGKLEYALQIFAGTEARDFLEQHMDYTQLRTDLAGVNYTGSPQQLKRMNLRLSHLFSEYAPIEEKSSFPGMFVENTYTLREASFPAFIHLLQTLQQEGLPATKKLWEQQPITAHRYDFVSSHSKDHFNLIVQPQKQQATLSLRHIPPQQGFLELTKSFASVFGTTSPGGEEYIKGITMLDIPGISNAVINLPYRREHEFVDNGILTGVLSHLGAQFIPKQNNGIEDYLMQGLGLQEESAIAVKHWLDGELSMDNVMQMVEKVSFESKNPVYFLNRLDGSQDVFKVHLNKEKASVEQAASFYLSQAGLPVASSKSSEPFVYGGVYLTHEVREQADAQQELDVAYRMKVLAKFHTHAKDILEDKVMLPTAERKEFAELFHEIKFYAKKHRVDLPDVGSMEARYNDGVDLLAAEETVATHGDYKRANQVGGKAIDLERMSLDKAAMDVAFVLNDPVFNIPQEHWKQYIDLYCHFCAEETGIDMTPSDRSYISAVVAQEKTPSILAAADVRGMESLERCLAHYDTYPDAVPKTEHLFRFIQSRIAA